MATRCIWKNGGATGWAHIVGGCCLVGLGTATLTAAAQPVAVAQPAAPLREWRYQIAPGDTLIALAATYLDDPEDWPRLQRHNAVADPRRLVPGSSLRIPYAWLRREATVAEVVFVQGSVSLQRPGVASALPLPSGSRVQAADTLRTAAQSSLSLRFADGSRLLIAPDSEVTVEQLLVYGRSGIVDSRLRVERGSADTQVQPTPGRAPVFEIRTPAINLGVRGTEFRVRVDPAARAARVEVLEGRVGARAEASPASAAPPGAPTDTLVNAGFGVRAIAQQPIEAPRALLPAPRLSERFATLDQLPLSLAWSSVDAAQAYRAQVYADGRPDALLRDAIFSGTTARWGGVDELPDGAYRLRVRALDAAGIEGRDAEGRFELRARPLAPALQSPAPGGQLAGDRVELSWAPQPEVLHYRLQVAAVADPGWEWVDRQVVGNRSELLLPPGNYQWRVASLARADAAGAPRQGPFGAIWRFELRALPALPELEPPQFSPAHLLLRWKSLVAGQGVQIQLADNPAFDPPLHDHPTWASQVQLPRPPAGSYFLRMRSLLGESVAGEFGPVQQISVPALAWWERWWLPAQASAR